jgi:geranylgeranyl diphosphate synthase type II
MRSELEQYLQARSAVINRRLTQFWENSHPLFESINYSLLGPGKRLRPILCLAAYEAAGGHGDRALDHACALEMIHCYSLIHDDLPAMDNDDYRRGRLTNHRVFGEAMAILAGDGLLTTAFELMSTPVPGIPVPLSLTILRLVAQAAGPHGMVRGQADDILPHPSNQNREYRQKYLEDLCARKTGALLKASLLCGAMLAQAPPQFLAALEIYGAKIGLAFQIADDILDVEGSPQKLGKSINKDAAQGKITYPALLGMEQARALGQDLAKEAAQLAHTLNSQPLRWLAEYVINRDS